jgi:hypothetical protein
MHRAGISNDPHDRRHGHVPASDDDSGRGRAEPKRSGGMPGGPSLPLPEGWERLASRNGYIHLESKWRCKNLRSLYEREDVIAKRAGLVADAELGAEVAMSPLALPQSGTSTSPATTAEMSDDDVNALMHSDSNDNGADATQDVDPAGEQGVAQCLRQVWGGNIAHSLEQLRPATLAET